MPGCMSRGASVGLRTESSVGAWRCGLRGRSESAPCVIIAVQHDKLVRPRAVLPLSIVVRFAAWCCFKCPPPAGS
eukprot:7321271-Alexandrium_andersonii.AAC.1